MPTTTSSKLSAVGRHPSRELPVVLADDVLRRPRLSGRSAFVVQNAHDGPFVHERVEQSSPRYDHGIPVLEED